MYCHLVDFNEFMFTTYVQLVKFNAHLIHSDALFVLCSLLEP